MPDTVEYVGRDLEAMSFARNYHRWILEQFQPHLGSRLVEVGAGTGSFSELLLELGPAALNLVEPSPEMYGVLDKRLRAPCVKTYNALFSDVAAELKREARPDSIIYVNVLEHVADDEGELRAVYDTLEVGGRVFIFVPALKMLYGKFDARIGHHRRYAKTELEEKCARAGFRVLRSIYFDAPGIITWWIKYRAFKSDSMEPGLVNLYDKVAVPVVRLLENLVSPPIGKNILLVAEK